MKDKRVLERVNVMMTREGLAFLERATKGVALNRSGVLRALVAALQASTLDLTRFKSEEDLALIGTCGLRSAAIQFPAYTLPKGRPGSVGKGCGS